MTDGARYKDLLELNPELQHNPALIYPDRMIKVKKGQLGVFAAAVSRFKHVLLYQSACSEGSTFAPYPFPYPETCP